MDQRIGTSGLTDSCNSREWIGYPLHAWEGCKRARRSIKASAAYAGTALTQPAVQRGGSVSVQVVG